MLQTGRCCGQTAGNSADTHSQASNIVSLSCHATCCPLRLWLLLSCPRPQAGNGIAWFSAAWVVIFESQSLAIRPAAVAVCIAAANLSASVIESKLLCTLRLMYYFLVLGVAIFALVRKRLEAWSGGVNE